MADDFVLPSKKAELAANLLLLAPPCEVDEVLKDVRALVGDNPEAENVFIRALYHYAKDQSLPVHLPGSSHKTLITEHGDLGDGRFFCPRMHCSFSLDPCSLSADDVRPLKPNNSDGGSMEAEIWRYALEEEMTNYLKEHYPSGSVSVYAPAKINSMQLTIYIEANYRKHQSTGRWRSCWTVDLSGKSDAAEVPVSGKIKVQTHIFEEGNVQLFAAQDFKFSLNVDNPQQFALDFVRKINDSDSEYQTAIGKHLYSMSTSTFKALRRQLPMTHSKLEWNKIAAYQVGNEISRSN